ncbi:MAG TPA: HAD family hydrolase [Dehalococcoidia bacterium]|nr:HAD family hydrolase [Dehalococcoidia bacterium]
MAKDRLYLFDIDGTLVNTGGAGSAAMRAAFAAIWGVEDGFRNVEFTGRSDLAIFQDALDAAIENGDDFPAAMRRFKRAYFRRLPGTLAAFDGRVLPGVPSLLEALSRDSDATLALGTGNFRTGAMHKLRHYGIDRYFRHGGFGDRTGDRPTLVAQGISAATRAHGRHTTVFVIGDTPHDVTAGKANDAIAVGVATGRHSEAELDAAGADIVLATLEDALRLLTRHD